MAWVKEEEILPFVLYAGRTRRWPAKPIAGHDAFHNHGEFCYLSTRIWMPSEPKVMWLTLNPQRPDRKGNEQAMRRMLGWSYRWGFGGMVVAYLYPLVTGHGGERQLWDWRDAALRQEGGADWIRFRAAATEAGVLIRRLRCQTKVAAWGRLDEPSREDLDDWLGYFRSRGPSWCLGVSANGDPLRPSARGASRPDEMVVLQPFSYRLRVAKQPPSERRRQEAAEARAGRAAVRQRRTVKPVQQAPEAASAP